MIESAAERLAQIIKSADPDDTTSTEVLRYGIAMSMNLLGVIVGCLIMGMITDHLGGTFAAFVTFAVLRRFSGGYHAKSLTACVVVSVVLFTVIPLLPANAAFLWGMKVCSLLLVSFLAPTNCQENDISEGVAGYFRVVSMLLVIGSIFIESPIVTLAIFSQSVLLIDMKRVKEVIIR